MRFFSLIWLLTISLSVYSQNIEFKASLPSVVEVGEQFRLVYTLNKEGKNIRLPEFEGVELLMGPSVGHTSSYTNVNGKISQTVHYSYTYLLRAVKSGKFSIPGAKITVDGKEYLSNALEIEVIDSGNRGKNVQSEGRSEASESGNKNSDKNLFVSVETSRKTLYVGEPFTADIKIYTRMDIVNFGQSRFPSFQGFVSEDMPIARRIELKRVAHDGAIYNMGMLRKFLLIPQHAGDITIEPFELESIVREELGGGASFFDDFFGNYRQRSLTRRSLPVKITVLPLPDAGKPGSFSGGVGKFSLTTSISSESIKANDALTYTVTVSGSGNLKLMNLSKPDLPEGFEIYDPKITKNIRQGEAKGSITYEYLIIPRYGGEYTVPAFEFSYFDPQTKSYKTLKGKEFKLHVEKGTEGNISSIIGSPMGNVYKKEDFKILREDIRFIHTGNLRLEPLGDKFFGTIAYWLWFILPAFIVVSGMSINRKRIKARADVVRVKNKAANKMARKRLKAAASALKNNNIDLFYDETLKGLWGYISYKLNIDTAALNRDNISGILTDKFVEETKIDEFIALLDDCEYARYAPGTNPEKEMQRIYESSIKVITSLDKSVK